MGLEAENVTWAAQRRWADTLAPSELVATGGVVEGLRLVKDAGEVARIAAAAAIADAALGEVLALLGQGRTEEEVALALDTAMRRLGSRGPRLRDHRGLGPERGQAPRPTERPDHRRRRPGGHRLRCHLRRLPLGHDADLLRRRCAGARTGPGVRRGGRGPGGRGGGGAPPGR